jgi:hypothetical protein
MFRAEDIATVLDPSAWDITTSAPQRPITQDGREITLTDAVLCAVRRAMTDRYDND